MKAPDKLYLSPVIYGAVTNLSPNPDCEGEVEYIRKDALMEWLEQNRNQSQMWFDRYHEKEDLSAKQVWEEVIDRINSM